MNDQPRDLTANEKAFLDMIATSEGTIGKGDDGYNVDVGGKLFDSYDDHPRTLVHLNAHLESSAAGRYQILARTYDAYADKLGLTDFSPAAQDAIALQLIKERSAYDDVLAGRFDTAVSKIKNIWASLPGAGYGQHENDLDRLRQAYVDAGGTVAA